MSEPKLVRVGPNQVVVNDVNAMPQRGQSAEKLWAFIAIDSEGNESVCGYMGPNGAIACVADKWERVEQLRPHMVAMARVFPKVRIVLRVYSDATDIETL